MSDEAVSELDEDELEELEEIEQLEELELDEDGLEMTASIETEGSAKDNKDKENLDEDYSYYEEENREDDELYYEEEY